MNKITPVAKRSKKAQKTFYNSRRGSWNGVRPVTRIVPSGKIYRRERQRSSTHDCA